MSGILDRLVAAFVAPVEHEAPRPGGWVEPAPPAAPAVAVLSAPDHAVAAGAAVALAVDRGVVVLAVWGATVGGSRAPASPRAGRLATRLADRGHDAKATGRLVVVTLAAGPDEAARVAAATDVPVVLLVAGPRDDHVDRVVRDHDRVLVVGDDRVATLAVESVRALDVRTAALALPDAATARSLASSGVALVAPWRALVREALA